MRENLWEHMLGPLNVLIQSEAVWVKILLGSACCSQRFYHVSPLCLTFVHEKENLLVPGYPFVDLVVHFYKTKTASGLCFVDTHIGMSKYIFCIPTFSTVYTVLIAKPWKSFLGLSSIVNEYCKSYIRNKVLLLLILCPWSLQTSDITVAQPSHLNQFNIHLYLN